MVTNMKAHKGNAFRKTGIQCHISVLLNVLEIIQALHLSEIKTKLTNIAFKLLKVILRFFHENWNKFIFKKMQEKTQ
jgi:hypothetical protein